VNGVSRFFSFLLGRWIYKIRMQTQRASWKKEGGWDRAWRIRSQWGGVGWWFRGTWKERGCCEYRSRVREEVGCGLWDVGMVAMDGGIKGFGF